MVGPTNWNLGASGDQQFANIAFDYEGDHRGLAISRLPGFLRIQPRVQHLMRSMAGGVQDMEDVIWGVIEGTILPSAVGDALDRWGALVGEPRGSLTSDSDYRPIIQARILANRCLGDVNSIMTVLSTATSPVVCIEFIELNPGPAAFQIQVTRESIMSEPRRLRVRRVMQDATPGGADARYIEVQAGGFGPPGTCGGTTFTGPLAREI